MPPSEDANKGLAKDQQVAQGSSTQVRLPVAPASTMSRSLARHLANYTLSLPFDSLVLGSQVAELVRILATGTEGSGFYFSRSREHSWG
jgi:hypothetical protein